MDNKIEMEEDPWYLEGAVIEIKPEPEDPLESDDVTESDSIVCYDMGSIVQIKEEPITLKCEEEEEEEEEEETAVVSENSFSQTEDIKIEIKEEAWWLHKSSIDVHDERKEIEEIIVLDSPAKETSRLCAELKCSDSCATNSHLKLGNSDPENNYTQSHIEVTKPKNTAALGVKSSSSIYSNGKKLHKCGRCCRSFVMISNLKAHMLIHTNGKKLHQCDICDKGYVRASSLKVHMLIHSNGKKLLQCDICDKSFVNASTLNAHMLIHSNGNKLHQCNICDKRFVNASTLNAHMLINSNGNELHQCDICNKSFVSASSLNAHMLIISNSNK